MTAWTCFSKWFIKI